MHVMLLLVRSGQTSPNELSAALKPGVTAEKDGTNPRMGIVADEDEATRYACLECGFSDEMTLPWAADG